MSTKPSAKTQPFRVAKLWPLGLFALSFLLVHLCKNNPQLTEVLFTQGVYRGIMTVVSRFFGLFPLSAAELALIFGVVYSLSALLKIITAVRKNPQQAVVLLKKFVYNAFAVTSCLLLAFLLTGGLNYYRPTYAELFAIEQPVTTTDDLRDLCVALVEKVNALRPLTLQDENGVFALEEQNKFLLATALHTDFNRFVQQNGRYGSGYRYSKPKPLLLSEIQSQMQILGIYSFFTGEPCVNVNAPDLDLPSSFYHEQAHLLGFMREDEANFIAFLAAQSSEDAAFSYCGYLHAFIYCSNALAKVDYNLYTEVYNLLSAEVKRDLAANSAFWRQYDTPIAHTANSINNSYLKANNQEDGVISYSMVVRLLLWEYLGAGTI